MSERRESETVTSALTRVAAWEWELENDRLRLSVSIERVLALPKPIPMAREQDFVGRLDARSAEKLRGAMKRLILEREPFVLLLNFSAGGEQREIEVHALASERKNGRVTRVGGIAAQAGMHKSPVEMAQVQNQIARFTNADTVTGLLNRNAFYRKMDDLLAGRDEASSILSLRIGEMRLVNEACSLDDGDELLREVADVIRALTPEEALLARTGGGRFFICLPQHAGGARVVAERVSDGVRDYQFVRADQVFSLSVAIGIATQTSARESAAELAARAQSASRLASSHGRSQIQDYDPSNTDVKRHAGDLEWSARLHAALVEGNFVLYQQPIEPLQPNNGMRLVELLLRMRGPDGELILPDRFIPVAERHQLMTTVDRWVVREALPLLTQVPDDVGFVLNISGQSLGETGFFSFIADQISLSDVNPQRIAFEITQTAAISNFERAIRFISIYRGLGCKFLLDDVGSGNNSLFNLRRLPVDMVKIEGSFVRGMLNDRVDEVIVRSVHEIAKTSNMLSIAESVESKATLSRLREMGIDYAQGYWVGEPEELTVTSLGEALRQSRLRVSQA